MERDHLHEMCYIITHSDSFKLGTKLINEAYIQKTYFDVLGNLPAGIDYYKADSIINVWSGNYENFKNSGEILQMFRMFFYTNFAANKNKVNVEYGYEYG